MTPLLQQGTAWLAGNPAAAPAGFPVTGPGYNSAEPTSVEPEGDVTILLMEWNAGDPSARDRLIPLLYAELKRLAEHYLRGESGARTLQPTALVHEAYMRLVKQKLPEFRNRSHFLGVAAHLMRQLLVENARRRGTQKRGGGLDNLPLEDALTIAPESSAIVLDLDSAMRALAAVDERKSRLMEVRFFGGLTIEETAETLGMSTAAVVREQRLAEAWLHRKMRAPRE